MPDMKGKKLDFATMCIDYATKANALTRDIVELSDYWRDNGFAVGGANPIVQSDLDGTTVAHLTPAMLASFISAIGNVNLTPAQRTVMRQVAKKTIPDLTR